MATVEVTKKIEISEEVGMYILEHYFCDNDFAFLDQDERFCFEDLNIKNSIIFLKELKRQLTNLMDNIIKKYEKAEENYGSENIIDFHEVIPSLYL